MTKVEMLGQRFGKLLVTKELHRNSSWQVMWECLCDCGSVKINAGTDLRTGRTKSCGCDSPKFTSERMKKHGLSRSRTYRIWNGMKMRCSIKATGSAKKNYYDKGIRVCEEWTNFENFYKDMGECPDGYTLGRIDGNKNYEPNNCKYETYKEQANNTSKNRKITYKGLTLNVSQWAEKLNIKSNTLVYRLKRNWTVEKALDRI